MQDAKTPYPSSQVRMDKQKLLFLEQLQKTPIIQVVCERLSIARTTLYRWRREDPAFEEQVQSALEEGTGLINDLAESKLIKRISEEDMSAIRLWLQTHHARYSNKVQVSLTRASEELTQEEIDQIESSLRHLNLLPTVPYEQSNGSEQGDESVS